MNAPNTEVRRTSPLRKVLALLIISSSVTGCGAGFDDSAAWLEGSPATGNCVDRGSGVVTDQFGTKIVPERFNAVQQTFRWGSYDYSLEEVRSVEECGTDDDGPFVRHRASFTIYETDRLQIIHSTLVGWELTLADGTSVPGVVERGLPFYRDGATELWIDFPLVDAGDLVGAHLQPYSLLRENREPLLIPLDHPLDSPFPLELAALGGRSFERYVDDVPQTLKIVSATISLDTDNDRGSRAELGHRYLEVVFDGGDPDVTADSLSYGDIEIVVAGEPVPKDYGEWLPRDVSFEGRGQSFVFDLREEDKELTLSVRTNSDVWEHVQVTVPLAS